MLGKTERVILGTILFVGAALRIYNYWDFSLSNDELSALARLNFDSFSDLIMNGVRIDGHPPAAQVILWYMTNLFGNGVAVVRLPFVLAGILSIWFMFRTAKEWISTSAGLLSAAAFATLEFPILYSRIARPYALGMLFTLMAAYFWVRVTKDKQTRGDFIWLAISLALCAYSHYFAALTAAILAFMGLFLIKGQSLKKYMLSLVGAFLLFAPYIPNFLYQLSLGGVGQWLGPPQNDWLWQHIQYVFNDSYLTLISIVLLGGLGFQQFKKGFSVSENLLPLFLFLAPFPVGFSYSKWVNPVLQNSTLLFSFPFLLIFIFSGWKDEDLRLTPISVSVLLVITLFSTVIEKRFFRTEHFGVFKELAEKTVQWNNEFNGQALLIGDYNYPFYIDYYFNRIEPTELALYRTSDEYGMAELKSIVDTSSSEYAIYSWSTVNQGPEIQAIIREKFPIELKREKHFNSEVVMYKKGNVQWVDVVPFRFEKTSNWNFNPEKITTDSTGIRSILMDNESPYGPTFMIAVDSLTERGITELNILIECSTPIDSTEIQLVYEQENANSKYSWESDPFDRQFTATSPKWGVFSYWLKTSENDSGTLKIYPWSPTGEHITIYRMEIRYR